MGPGSGRDDVRQRIEAARRRLLASRALGPVAAVGMRFREIDGANQGVLISVQLFTVFIPLMILGFGYLSGFAENISLGVIWIRELGLAGESSDTVRDAFGTSDKLQAGWNVVGIAAFLVWGIPMAITVAGMFAKAWQREQFGPGQRMVRGAAWLALYLVMTVVRERIAFGTDHDGAIAVLLFAASMVPVWAFWSLTPVLLVRDGGYGLRYLALAGLAGVVIDGILIPVLGRIAFPMVIDSWTEFGPIGVAMALITWCVARGTGWVVTACVAAVLWERRAPTETVLAAQTAGTEPAESG